MNIKHASAIEQCFSWWDNGTYDDYHKDLRVSRCHSQLVWIHSMIVSWWHNTQRQISQDESLSSGNCVCIESYIWVYIKSSIYIQYIFLENKLFIKMLVSWHQDKNPGSYTRESVEDTYVGTVYLPGNPDALRGRGLQVNFLRWTIRSCRNQKHRGRLYTPEADSFLL